jgi:hypothetical protein
MRERAANADVVERRVIGEADVVGAQLRFVEDGSVGKVLQLQRMDENEVEAPRLPLVARSEGIADVDRELGDVGRR